MFARLFSFLALFLVAACGGPDPQRVPTASAVAFTEDAQNYGYCYDVADANLCAEKYCSEGAGRACQTQFSSPVKGYYALALGNLGWGIGFSESDKEAAGQSAMDKCWQQTQGCRVVETWLADGVK